MGAGRGWAAATAALATLGLASACAAGSGAGHDRTRGTLADAAAARSSDAPATPRTGPGVRSHRVPDASCPEGWSGLVVTADSVIRSDHLDDLVACTDRERATTYVENHSHQVWVLREPAATRQDVWRFRSGLADTSFLQVAREVRHAESMTPGSVLTVGLPPARVSWALDLPLTFGFEAHRLTVDAMRSGDEAGADDALLRQGADADVLPRCTTAVVDRVTRHDLDRQTFRDGLGLVEECRVPDDATAAVADSVEHLRYAEAVAREVPQGLRLVLPR